jgi:5,10-methylenetetrahydrofolate reductase
VASGAQFFVTPPVFNLELFSGFMQKVANRKAKIIPTVLLLKSVGMARYIDRHLENVSVPLELISRIQKAQDKARECVNIAAELVAALRDVGCSGVLLSPLGWEHKLLDILEGPKA